jgi:hypothetical protein
MVDKIKWTVTTQRKGVVGPGSISHRAGATQFGIMHYRNSHDDDPLEQQSQQYMENLFIIPENKIPMIHGGEDIIVGKTNPYLPAIAETPIYRETKKPSIYFYGSNNYKYYSYDLGRNEPIPDVPYSDTAFNRRQAARRPWLRRLLKMLNPFQSALDVE